MRSLNEMWRDWRRGYSEADLTSVLEKVQIKEAQPGAFIPVSRREMRAHYAYLTKIFPLHPVKAAALVTDHNDRRAG
jgi:hypothetical protein